VILTTTRRELSGALGKARNRGKRVGLVPTMGYLHQGHLALVDSARSRSEFVTVSIFVNPLQFAAGEDLDRYPRDLDRDLALLKTRGVDLVFHPSLEEMYPEGDPRVMVDPGPMGDVLCGAYRPGHFRGVLTVVARLFGLFRPDVAVFGRKDFQQAILIQRMVSDLELQVEINLSEIVREEDGLAMSSRNVFLSPEERGDAIGIRKGLLAVQEAFRGGAKATKILKEVLRRDIQNYPGLELQYGEVVHPETLEGVKSASQGNVMAVAAHCGGTRLIDNLILGG